MKIHNAAQDILSRHLPISIKISNILFSIAVVALGSWILLVFFGVTPVQENLIYLCGFIIVTFLFYLVARTAAPIEIEQRHTLELGQLKAKLSRINTPSIELKRFHIQYRKETNNEIDSHIHKIWLEITNPTGATHTVDDIGVIIEEGIFNHVNLSRTRLDFEDYFPQQDASFSLNPGNSKLVELFSFFEMATKKIFSMSYREANGKRTSSINSTEDNSIFNGPHKLKIRISAREAVGQDWDIDFGVEQHSVFIKGVRTQPVSDIPVDPIEATFSMCL